MTVVLKEASLLVPGGLSSETVKTELLLRVALELSGSCQVSRFTLWTLHMGQTHWGL